LKEALPCALRYLEKKVSLLKQKTKIILRKGASDVLPVVLQPRQRLRQDMFSIVNLIQKSSAPQLKPVESAENEPA
jgi:hypothetical protein